MKNSSLNNKGSEVKALKLNKIDEIRNFDCIRYE